MLCTLHLMDCLVSLISYTLTFLSVFDFCHSSSMFVCSYSYFTQELLPVILIEVSQKINNVSYLFHHIQPALLYFTSDCLFQILVISFHNSFFLWPPLLVDDVSGCDFTKNYWSISLSAIIWTSPWALSEYQWPPTYWSLKLPPIPWPTVYCAFSIICLFANIQVAS